MRLLLKLNNTWAMLETDHALPAAFLAAERGAPPLHGAQPHVETVHQLLSVLQLDQLEGLLGAHADDDRVGQQVGALRLLNGQNLAEKHQQSYQVQARGGILERCGHSRELHNISSVQHATFGTPGQSLGSHSGGVGVQYL